MVCSDEVNPIAPFLTRIAGTHAGKSQYRCSPWLEGGSDNGLGVIVAFLAALPSRVMKVGKAPREALTCSAEHVFFKQNTSTLQTMLWQEEQTILGPTTNLAVKFQSPLLGQNAALQG